MHGETSLCRSCNAVGRSDDRHAGERGRHCQGVDGEAVSEEVSAGRGPLPPMTTLATRRPRAGQHFASFDACGRRHVEPRRLGSILHGATSVFDLGGALGRRQFGLIIVDTRTGIERDWENVGADIHEALGSTPDLPAI